MSVDALPARTGSEPTRPSRAALIALGAAGSVGFAIPLVAPHVSWYEGPVDVWPILADAFSFASFVFLGLYAYAKRPDNRVGPLMMAVGLTPLLTQIGWIATDVTYTLGTFLFPELWLAVLAHLFLAFPSGRLGSAFDRGLVPAIYVWFAVSSLVPLFFHDFLANGWRFDNVLLIRSDNELADTLGRASSVITGLFGAVFVLAMVRHWRQASSAGRRVLAPVVLASVPTMAWVALRVFGDGLGYQPLNTIAESPLGALATAALPIGFAVGLLRTRLGRSRVGDLVVELGETSASGKVRDTLAAILRDPSLEIAYRLPGSDAYVDEAGRPVELVDIDGRAVSPIERDGEPIAALVHDPAVLDDPELFRSALAAVRLAVENERLQAEVRAQLVEVRASRARIVQAGDAERRRVERNLHDGAQQRLVTLSLGLGRIRDRAAREGDPAIAAQLEETAAELKAAIAELRELARGIHPSILTEEGLGAAIESLALRSPVPVTVEEVPGRRFPDPVEATGYFVVSEALANVARYASASTAFVRAWVGDDAILRIEVRDDGVGGADLANGSGLRGLQDRVAAVGGSLGVASPRGGGTTLVAEIPCDGR